MSYVEFDHQVVRHRAWVEGNRDTVANSSRLRTPGWWNEVGFWVGAMVADDAILRGQL